MLGEGLGFRAAARNLGFRVLRVWYVGSWSVRSLWLWRCRFECFSPFRYRKWVGVLDF